MTAAPKLVEPPPAPQSKNLIQKCAAVMAALQYVPKNGWNDFHKYHYATEADIADAVRESMAKEGVMLIPSVEKIEWREVAANSGKPERIATLTVRYRLTDGATTEEFTIIGEGQDRGDKATYKAMTGATKYALLKLFLISTGDDPEADDGEKPPPARGASPRTEKPAPAAVAAPQPEPKAETPPHVAHAWEIAKKVYGSADKAREPFKVAVQSRIGARPSHSMTEAEALDVEAILNEHTKPADIPF